MKRDGNLKDEEETKVIQTDSNVKSEVDDSGKKMIFFIGIIMVIVYVFALFRNKKQIAGLREESSIIASFAELFVYINMLWRGVIIGFIIGLLGKLAKINKLQVSLLALLNVIAYIICYILSFERIINRETIFRLLVNDGQCTVVAAGIGYFLGVMIKGIFNKLTKNRTKNANNVQ